MRNPFRVNKSRRVEAPEVATLVDLEALVIAAREEGAPDDAEVRLDGADEPRTLRSPMGGIPYSVPGRPASASVRWHVSD